MSIPPCYISINFNKSKLAFLVNIFQLQTLKPCAALLYVFCAPTISLIGSRSVAQLSLDHVCVCHCVCVLLSSFILVN